LRIHCSRGKAISIAYSECVSVDLLSSIQSVCAVLYCHLWPVRPYHIFAHYLTKGTIKKHLLNIKFVFGISVQLSSDTYLILRIIRPNIIINYVGFRVEYPLFVSHINETNSDDRFSKNTLVSNLMKILPVEPELFHADGQTGR
jgi:hypothetical protein